MSGFNQDLILMILQFLNDEKYKETAHMLEKESGVFFNMKYLENEVMKGNWAEVEKYLLGFTLIDANRYSYKMFFEIRKHKYLEALDKHEYAKAVDILMKDLKFFKTCDQELYNEMTNLLMLKNFRYRDAISGRTNLLYVLKTHILANPDFKDKLDGPILEPSRLRTLIDQSLNWQHSRGAPLLSAHQNDNTRNSMDVTPELPVEADLIFKTWDLTEISEPAHIQSWLLPDPESGSRKIPRLTYSSSGDFILAITSNGIHMLWKWPKMEHNPTKATTSMCPQLWNPNGNRMINVIMVDTDPEEVRHCFALSDTNSYTISASGGNISLFNMMTFERMFEFMHPPPSASCLMFYPKDNNVFVIGMEDSTIKIYYMRDGEIIKSLEGHNNSRRITGLAFSKEHNVLVSADENAQILVWKWNTWEMQNRTHLINIPVGRRTLSDTRLQILRDHIHFLVVHQSQLAVYEITRLKLVHQWIPHESSVQITDAILSCDNDLVYASFKDATVCVFSAATLEPQCRIHPSAYLPANVSTTVHPLAIAAHPSQRNQFAMGLTDGSVYVLEPLEYDGKWPMDQPRVEKASAEREVPINFRST